MPENDQDFPDYVDARLWFVSRRCGQRDYLCELNPHTYPGRMRAYCPHADAHPFYHVSAYDLDDCSPETRLWSRGFVVGNEPGPPVDENGYEVEDDTPEYKRWQDTRSEYLAKGVWPTDVPHN